jgi:hypothetical protein
MFGHDEDYAKEMADMREKEKIQRIKLGIESEEGLELNTDRVRGAVEYAGRGGGSIKAKTKKKQTFNSKNKSKKIIIPKNKEENVSVKDLIFEAVKRIFT